MNKLLVVLLLVSLSVIAVLAFLINTNTIEERTKVAKEPLPTNCQPTFRDGGGPYYHPNAPFRSKIVPDNNNGDRLTVSGRILTNDCKTTLKNAVLDVWQANESGNYEDEWYRGQIRTNDEGSYSFETVIPKGYGEGSGFRPPHIHFKVWQNGQELVTSQMFFPESKGKPGFDDAYIMMVEEKNGSFTVYHDIILP